MLIARWIAELLAATHGPGKWLSADVFRTNLNTCIERVSDGNISRFCAATGWRPRVSVADGVDRLTQWIEARFAPGRGSFQAKEMLA